MTTKKEFTGGKVQRDKREKCPLCEYGKLNRSDTNLNELECNHCDYTTTAYYGLSDTEIQRSYFGPLDTELYK